jgi:hypothetical protein
VGACLPHCALRQWWLVQESGSLFFLGVRWGGGAVWHAHWQCKQLVAAAEYHVQTSSASQLLWQCCT